MDATSLARPRGAASQRDEHPRRARRQYAPFALPACHAPRLRRFPRVPAADPQLRVRAGRTAPGQARALASSGRASCCLRRRAARLARRCSAATRRWSSRSASAWASATAAIAAALPQRDFLGIEVHPPGVGALLQRIDEQRPRQRAASSSHDAVEVLESHDRARLAGRRARLLPRPLAQEAASQAPPDPAAVRAAAGRAGSRPAATLHCATDWQPYAEQMLEVLSAEPLLANSRRRGYRAEARLPAADQVRAARAWPRPRRVGPVCSCRRLKRRTDGHLRPQSCPDDDAAPGGREHDQAEGDAVPGERHEGRGVDDVAQQPAHAQPGARGTRTPGRPRTAAGRPPRAARAPSTGCRRRRRSGSGSRGRS